MGQRRKEWVEVVEAVGQSFLAVLRSEWTVLKKIWEGSARHLGLAVGLFALAILLSALVVVLVVVATVLAVQHFAHLQPWAAVLWVAFAVLLVAAVLGAVGYFVFLRRFENPVTSARERFEDHLVWWRQSLLDEERTLPRGATREENRGEFSDGEQESGS